MNRIWLCCTTLACTLPLAANGLAQEVRPGGALDITITGYSQFDIEFADEDFGFGTDGPREWFFNQDHEVEFEVDGVADAMNLSYGASLQLELGGPSSTGARWDEAWAYVSGSWGEVRLGDEDAVTESLVINGEFNAAGSGGLDGDQRTAGDFRHDDSGEATKIIYFTPQIAGFQGGINYAINGDDRGSAAGSNTATSNHIDLGANWEGSFGGFDLGAYGGLSTFTTAKTATPDDETAINYTIGGYVGFAGFSLAAGFSQNDSDVFTEDGATSWLANVGLGAEIAGVTTSLAYQFTALRNSDNQNQYILSGDYGIAPGIAVIADIAYVTDFEGDDDADGINALAGLEVSF